MAADTLTAMPAAGLAKPLRVQAKVVYGAATGTPAWQRFAATGSWEAWWDAATGVPSRIWGSGIAVPGAMANPAIAEAAARAALAQHIALLAPGSAVTDFELVSNHYDGDIRSIGFIQRAGGRRVVGGQVSFRFKKDRLFVIGSEALPSVRVVEPYARIAPSALRDRAIASLRSDLALPDAPVTALDDEVILPLVGDDSVQAYRVVRALTIDGGARGRYLAYADAATGAVIAVHQQNLFATGTVLYHGIDRYPARPRIDRVAPRAHVTLDGISQTTASDGTLSWSPDVAKTLGTSVVGDLVVIVNKATSGALASATMALAPGGLVVWDASAMVEDDAQVQVYLDINIVKDYARTIDPALALLDQQMTANVNIDMECNAFFDGKAINFFHASTMCQNTGLVQDVLFHEFGHAVHANELVMGVGAFDGAMSEGAADFLAASMTGDPGMGRGFFYNDMPLRDIDPPDQEYKWPIDIGEIHHTGLIFSGTYWDLRKALIAAFGQAEGIALVQKLWVGALRRSINIPTSLIEALAADDDDGDLSNGTPHECFIRDAYGRHGLRTATGVVVAPGAIVTSSPSIPVIVGLQGLSTRCGGDEIQEVSVSWKPGYSGAPAAGSADALQLDSSRYYFDLPLADRDVLWYQANVGFSDGSVLTLPDNLGDQNYQIYQGPTLKLYCTSFDTDPFKEGWTTGTGDNGPSPWAWGMPPGTGATDPPKAFSGENILALGLGTDYAPNYYSWVKSPPIDVGHYSDVRVQYRRWLAVEDSHFDQAQVTANDHKAWVNFTANMGDSSSTHHIDREWRFHDVPVSGLFLGHTLTVGFDLRSDPGLQLGGWAIDDFCVVANPLSICGDGVTSLTEECDTGAANADVADTCRTNCRLPFCGDGIVDSNEECDQGEAGTDTCSPMCKTLTLAEVGGCCSAGGNPAGPCLLGGLVGLLVLRRRRTR